ncbi:MAG TPA: alkaline phosphatase family protein [Longimicrobiaceae bacterium]|nr:alkaline phosphatase family protein [Longimicrobiaceae bacterium]
MTPVPRLPRLVRAAPLLALCAWLASACSPALLQHADRRFPQTHVRHVVVISVDGLRPDAIEAAGAVHLRRLMDEGAYTLQARTITPSKTLPSHTSMLTGVSPAKHGITWNDDRVDETGRVGVPTVFDLADSAGLRTAAFFGKAKFRHLVGAGDPGFWASVPRGAEVLLAPRMVEDVERYLKYRDPELLFVHVSDPDIAGHSTGWMSAPYRAAVRRADAAVGRILRAARARYGDDMVLIVTADHGGHSRTHGTESIDDMTIPWIAWGKGITPGPIAGPVTTFDTAATVLWLLGIPRPEFWDGRPVTEAFAFGADRQAEGVTGGVQ